MRCNCARLVLAVALTLGAVGCAAQPAPTPTPVPKPTEPVEVPVAGAEDVMGVWLVTLTMGAGQGHVEFGKGTYAIKGISGDAKGVTIGTGTYEVAGGQLRWGQGDCITVKGELVQCVGVYQAFVVKQGGKSVRLRLKTVEDQAADRSQTFNNQTLTRVEP